MKNISESSRRNFIKKFATASAAVAVGTDVFAAESKAGYFEKLKRTPSSPNDKINIVLIGAGGMGIQDVLTALKIPNTKLVAVCDLYAGRLQEANPKGGTDRFLTHHYKGISNPKDVYF